MYPNEDREIDRQTVEKIFRGIDKQILQCSLKDRYINKLVYRQKSTQIYRQIKLGTLVNRQKDKQISR